MSKPPDDKKSQADQARAIANMLSRSDQKRAALDIAQSLEPEHQQPKPKRKPRPKRKKPDPDSN